VDLMTALFKSAGNQKSSLSDEIPSLNLSDYCLKGSDDVKRQANTIGYSKYDCF